MKAYFRRLILPLLERNLRRLIAAHDLKVVAVAGSVGKTSTKLAVAAVLEQKYRVMVHRGNYNDAMSVPMAAFGLEMPGSIINPFAWLIRLIQMEARIRGQFDYDVLVLELGTDHPGEIPRFLTYLQPDAGIVTAVAPEHMEFFGTLEAVADEELALVAGSTQAYVGLESDYTRRHQRSLAKTARLYGTGGEIAWTEQGISLGSDPAIAATTSLAGDHIKAALAVAAAVGRQFELTDKQITAGVESFTGVPGRMQILAGLDGATLIDDTYNSSPEAVTAALATLRDWTVPAGGRRIAILGTMNELGDESARYHREAGASVYAAGVDLLVTIGDMANRALGPGTVKAGMDPNAVKPADSPYAAGQFVAALLHAGDVVLVKGSQNRVFAEEAAKLLLADPADAVKLVRQSPAWLAKKRAQFSEASRKAI